MTLWQSTFNLSRSSIPTETGEAQMEIPYGDKFQPKAEMVGIFRLVQSPLESTASTVPISASESTDKMPDSTDALKNPE